MFKIWKPIYLLVALALVLPLAIFAPAQISPATANSAPSLEWDKAFGGTDYSSDKRLTTLTGTCEMNLVPAEDCYVDSYDPDDNYGGDGSLYAKSAIYTYLDNDYEISHLKFDLTVIPANATINSIGFPSKVLAGQVYSYWQVYSHWLEDSHGQETTDFTLDDYAVHCQVRWVGTPYQIRFKWFNPEGSQVFNVVRGGHTLVHYLYDQGVSIGAYGPMEIEGMNRQPGKWHVEFWGKRESWSGWELRFTEEFTISEAGEDILAYYRAYSGDPNVVDTTDLLKAADDWASEVTPPGFTEPITTEQLLQLADEWATG